MAVANRAYIENLIYDTFSALDPSGTNTEKYRSLFGSMDDKQFEKYMRSFLANDEERFMLDIVDFEHGLKMEWCKAGLDVIGVPLMEDVYMPWLTMDKKHVVVSKEKCLVGYINVKRPQQMVHKKNGISVSNTKTSSLTNQVIDKDKNARDSDIEATMLVSLGADKILQEFHGPRSDDAVMKREMNQSIANRGYVLLDELTNLPTNKATLNTVNTFLLAMGLKSDLITDSYIFPKTSEDLFGD